MYSCGYEVCDERRGWKVCGFAVLNSYAENVVMELSVIIV